MNIKIRHLGQQDYLSCWQKMQDYTLARDENSTDEIWIVEHPPVLLRGLMASLSIYYKYQIYPWSIPIEADKLPIMHQGN